MRRMNWRFLGIIVVAGVALGAAVFGLHEFQVSRHARFFLDQAHRAKEEKKAGEAIGYLNRYLQLAPDDTDALAELGLLLAERRMDRAAYATLEKVLRSNPNRTEARRKLVEVGIRLRRYRDAKEHLQGYLLKEAPKDGQLREWLGACQAAQGDSAAAAKSLQLAVQYAPSRIETYRHLAELLRYRLDRPEEADQWMEKLIAANPKDSRAHRDYGEYLAGIGQHDRAAQQAAEALEIAPHDADSLLLAARCALARGKYQEGRQYAQRGLKLHPKLTALYASLAAIELRSGQRNEAIAALRQGAASAAEPAPLKWQLASLLLDAGKVEEARPIAGELRAGGYSESLVVYLEARIDYAQGHWLAASREFQGIHADMADRPDLAASADYWLGNCYGELGDTERQLASYRSAVAENLSWLPPRLAAVAVLESMGRLDEAMDEQRQILKIDGTFAGGWLNLARLELLSNLRLEPARRNWHGVEEALAPVAAANPKSAEVALFRAEVLFAEGRIAEAEKLLSDAQGDNPKDVRVRVARADLAERQQQWDRAAAVVDEARQQLGDRCGRWPRRPRAFPGPINGNCGAASCRWSWRRETGSRPPGSLGSSQKRSPTSCPSGWSCWSWLSAGRTPPAWSKRSRKSSPLKAKGPIGTSARPCACAWRPNRAGRNCWTRPGATWRKPAGCGLPGSGQPPCSGRSSTSRARTTGRSPATLRPLSSGTASRTRSDASWSSSSSASAMRKPTS